MKNLKYFAIKINNNYYAGADETAKTSCKLVNDLSDALIVHSEFWAHERLTKILEASEINSISSASVVELKLVEKN